MKKILILFLTFSLSGILMPVFSAKKNNEVITPQTQLQKRQYQTRQYDSISKAALMKAMLNVLQDEGFIVSNANPLLGFISGSKEFSTNDKTIDIEKEFGTKKGLGGAAVAVVEATANVTEFGNEIRVRINFKRKLLNIYGNAQKIEEINDETYYQNFFSLVDKAIFIQKQKI
ncbi:hypothetical protein IJ732_02495 [bacterium]|nr:hypothetical protein [bacterium]